MPDAPVLPENPPVLPGGAGTSPPGEPPAPAGAPGSAPTPATAAQEPARNPLHDAFTLGWEIVELKSRIEIALMEPNESGLRLASTWRASFNRIAALQSKAFPEGTTVKTLYEPPGRDVLPYLYHDNPDYADVGIRDVDADNKKILESFALFEVTRRAINSLTLLYVKEAESLVPEDIQLWQGLLIAQIKAAAKNPEGGGGDPSADKAIAASDKIADTAPEASNLPPDSDLEYAKKILSERIGKFLDAWDGFLRETYYTGGAIHNDEMELVAYEAGRAMSSLSWSISVATVPLELAWEAGQLASTQDIKQDPYVAAWHNAFRDQAVIRLQHQISALSATLDDAYYDQHKGVERPDPNAVLITPNPDLPSQAIQAVKNSIDYWQRALVWISENASQMRHSEKVVPELALLSRPIRMALTEQANIWQTLMTGQQSLRAYNMESMTHKIIEDVTAEIQQSVRTDFNTGVQQAEEAMKEVAQEAKGAMAAVSETAVGGLEALFQSFSRFFWPILGGIGVLCIVLIGIALMSQTKDATTTASGGVGLAGIISAILGYFGLGNLREKKDQQQTAIKTGAVTAAAGVDNKAIASTAGNGSLLTRIEGAAQETGSVVLQAFERGYEQMRIELDSLNRSVAVAYPLVEFFGLHFTLESDVNFLTGIIWSGTQRADEIKDVLRAAFGPLAMLITSSPPTQRASQPSSALIPTKREGPQG